MQHEPTDETIKKKKLMSQFKKMGILSDDPRISKMVQYLDEHCDDDIGLIDFTKALAGKGVKTNPNIEFILRVIT